MEVSGYPGYPLPPCPELPGHAGPNADGGDDTKEVVTHKLPLFPADVDDVVYQTATLRKKHINPIYLAILSCFLLVLFGYRHYLWSGSFRRFWGL